MPKKVLIALPPAMLEQVDYIAQCEHRTRSDLIREALRRYLDNFRRTSSGAAYPTLVVNTIKENTNAPDPRFTSIPDNGRDFFTRPTPGPVTDHNRTDGEVDTADAVYQGPIIG